MSWMRTWYLPATAAVKRTNESAPKVSSFSAMMRPCGSRTSSRESSGEPSRAAWTSAQIVCPLRAGTTQTSTFSRGKMRPLMVTGSGTSTGTGSPSISCSTISGRSPTMNFSAGVAPWEVQSRQ